jgi:hypothetical protein
MARSCNDLRILRTVEADIGRGDEGGDGGTARLWMLGRHLISDLIAVLGQPKGAKSLNGFMVLTCFDGLTNPACID